MESPQSDLQIAMQYLIDARAAFDRAIGAATNDDRTARWARCARSFTHAAIIRGEIALK